MKNQLLKFYVIMKRHPQSFVLCFSFVCFLLRLWLSVDGGTTTRPAAKPEPHLISPFVTDVYTGSLLERNRHIARSEVSLVFYYAPWCSDSAKGLAQFVSVAEQYYSEVSFIAVNCWWDKGECRGSNEIRYFPQVFLHHKLVKNAVHYSGPMLARYLSDFLEKSLSSATYLGNWEELDKFSRKSQISVVGYLPLPSSIHLLAKFMAVSLTSLQSFPEQVVSFGVVTSRVLAQDLLIQKGQARKFDRLYGDLQPVATIDLYNLTVDGAHSLALKDNAVVVSNILASSRKSNSLFTNLKDGPTLLAFVSNLDQIQMVEEIALKYYHQCYDRRTCQAVKLNTAICRVCAISEHPEVPPAIAETLISSFLRMESHILSFLHNDCYVTKPLYDTQRTRIESCCYSKSRISDVATSILSLACKSNKTIGFVALNQEEFQAIAENLGLKANEAVSIVDLDNEEDFKMSAPLNSTNLERFILDFTHSKLPSTSKSFTPDVLNENGIQNSLEIPFVNAINFNNKVLNSTKDVLLLYQTSWCGFCSAYIQTLLSFKMQFPNMNNIEILQIGEDSTNQLSVSFRPTVIPSLILFPGNRTFDSVLFSPSKQMSFPNLIDFLLRHASPNTKTELILSECDLNGFLHTKSISACKLKEIMNRLETEHLHIQHWIAKKRETIKMLHRMQCNMTSLARAIQPSDLLKKKRALSKEQLKLREKMFKIGERIEQMSTIHTSIRNEVRKFVHKDEL